LRLISVKFLTLQLVAYAAVASALHAQGRPAAGSLPPWVDTTGESPVYPVGDAIPVYRAVLDLLYLDGDQRPGIIVMHDTAEGRTGGPCAFDKCVDHVWAHKSAIDTATVLAFARFSPKRPGIRDFGYSIPIVFLSNDDVQRMEADGREWLAAHPSPYTQETRRFWPEFKRKFPKAWGVVVLSKVGFNPKHTQALIQVHTWCGDECYTDEFLFLRQLKGRWRVVERIPNTIMLYNSASIIRYVGPVGNNPSESEMLPAPSRGVPPEASARAGVYRAVLDSLYSFDGERPRAIVLTDAFRGDDPKLPAHKSAIDHDLLERYAFLSAIPAPLDIHLRYPTRISILPRDSVLALNPAGVAVDPATMTSPPVWRAFTKRYPGAWGMVGFKRIAFNASRSEALVYTNHACGPACQNGDTWFLERSGSKWRIVERIPRSGAVDLADDRLRYLGADAKLDAYRPRSIQGVVKDAATDLPIAHLPMTVSITSVTDAAATTRVITTDSIGHYALTSLPLQSGVTMKVRCPPKSDHDTLFLNTLYVRPGIDTTADLSVDYTTCTDPPPPPNILAGAEAVIGTDEARFVFPLQSETTYVWDSPPNGAPSNGFDYNWYVSWEIPRSLDGKSPQMLWLIKRWKPGGPRKGSLRELIVGDTLDAYINCVTCDGAVLDDRAIDHTKVFATVEDGWLIFIVRGADAVRHVFPVVPTSVTFSASIRQTPKRDYGPGYESEFIMVPVTRRSP
jgi:hypothetical protein